MTVLGIVNQKGGVGKTTTSINLAYALRSRGQSVLIVDFDPQANCTTAMGIKETEIVGYKTVFDMLNFNNDDLISDLQSVKITAEYKKGPIDLIPSSRRLTRADNNSIDVPFRELLLMRMIQDSGADMIYDYIIIDSPPSPGFFNNCVLAASDQVIIPTTLGPLSFKGIQKTIETINVIRNNIPNCQTKLLGILPVKYNKSIKLHSHYLDEITSEFPNEKVLDYIPQDAKLERATSQGIPVDVYGKTKSGAAYAELAKQVIQ